MLTAAAILLLCQLAGESLSRLLAVPVPGPVIGIVLLGAGLALWSAVSRTSLEEAITAVSPMGDGLLRHMSLLFVPAGCGVVQHVGLLGEHALAIGAVLILSTALTMIATVWTFVWVRRFTGGA